MRSILSALLILGLFTLSPAIDLDSLLQRSSNATKSSKDMKGIIIGTYNPKLVSPDVLFKSLEQQPDPVLTHPSVLFGTRNDCRTQELEASMNKMALIIDNLQKQSDNHTANTNNLLKLFEILMGSVTTIVVAYIGVKLKSKS